MGKFIGFVRFSEREPDVNHQLKQLNDYGCDPIFSGDNSMNGNQVAMNDVFHHMQHGDAVVVTHIENLGRSLKQILNVIDALLAKQVGLVAIEQPIDTTANNPNAVAVMELMRIFAEIDHNLFAQRMHEGRMKSNKRMGRKYVLNERQRREIKVRLANNESKRSLAMEYDVSRKTILNIERDDTLTTKAESNQ